MTRQPPPHSHVLQFMPQPLIGCGREGWELVARGESGARVRPGGWQKALHLPRDAHAGALAACQLGYPVTLTHRTRLLREPSRCRTRRPSPAGWSWPHGGPRCRRCPVITKRQALTGESFNAVTGGRCILWRRNGCHRTWQTQPERFKIPVRRGLHDKDHPPRRRMPGPEHAMTSARRRWGRGREHVAGGAAYRMVQDGTRRAVIATWPGTDPAGAGVVAGWVAFDLRGHCRGRRARVRPLPGRSLPRPRVNPPRGGSPDRRRPPGNQPRALRRRSLTMPSRTAPQPASSTSSASCSSSNLPGSGVTSPGCSPTGSSPGRAASPGRRSRRTGYGR